mmetsp:Transcript_159748/g.512589  ORF Transcript_159748/g.512589 Transcript_159748/m.512589 type:complete len:541 (-) Transcript_159748:5134-6756(-)
MAVQQERRDHGDVVDALLLDPAADEDQDLGIRVLVQVAVPLQHRFRPHPLYLQAFDACLPMVLRRVRGVVKRHDAGQATEEGSLTLQLDTILRRHSANAMPRLHFLDVRDTCPQHVEAPLEGGVLPNRRLREVEDNAQTPKSRNCRPKAVVDKVGLDDTTIVGIVQHEDSRDLLLPRDVERSQRGMVVHAVVHIRLEISQELSDSLIPQGEEAEHAQLRHRGGIRSPPASLLKELMAQEVPVALNAIQLALQDVDLHHVSFAIHDDLELLVEVQVAIVDVAEHGVHEAEPTVGVLAKHLVEHLAKAAGAHLHLALRDGVLDGRRQDVLRLDEVRHGGRTVRARRLLDQAQVEAAAAVPHQDAHEARDPDRERRPSHEHQARRILVARILWQGWQVAADADQPRPVAVLLREVVGREDGDVARADLCGHHQVHLFADLPVNNRHARRVEQVHEGLPFLKGNSGGQAVLHCLRRRLGPEGQDDEHCARRTVGGVVVELPISKLVGLARNDLGLLVLRSAQRQARLSDSDQGLECLVDRIRTI